MELPDKLHEQITELSERGNDLSDLGRWNDAIKVWTQALDLVPDPKQDWEAATWLYASIGDAHRQAGQYEEAKHSLYDALNCPDGQANGFIHYRLGECWFALGEEPKAIESFLKAYMLEGDEIFDDEDGSDRGAYYLELLKKRDLI